VQLAFWGVHCSFFTTSDQRSPAYTPSAAARVPMNATLFTDHGYRTTSPQSASVNWTYIQKDLELSEADCLLIIDCCHSGTSITRGEATTINEILAASTHESPSYSGSRAYSKLLKAKLESISLPCSVEQIHQEMLSASRLRPISQSAGALRATPDHGWAGDSLPRSIRLRPLPTSDTDTTSLSDHTLEVRHSRK
jgi:hypothetical protein